MIIYFLPTVLVRRRDTNDHSTSNESITAAKTFPDQQKSQMKIRITTIISIALTIIVVFLYSYNRISNKPKIVISHEATGCSIPADKELLRYTGANNRSVDSLHEIFISSHVDTAVLLALNGFLHLFGFNTVESTRFFHASIIEDHLCAMVYKIIINILHHVYGIFLRAWIIS